MTPTEERLLHLLTSTRTAALNVKGDYARANADIVGIAASLQLITTQTGTLKFARAWHLTPKGLTYINERAA